MSDKKKSIGQLSVLLFSTAGVLILVGLFFPSLLILAVIAIILGIIFPIAHYLEKLTKKKV